MFGNLEFRIRKNHLFGTAEIISKRRGKIKKILFFLKWEE